MGRTLRLGLVLAALAPAGCRDLGVRGSANLPLAEARTRPAVFWAYQAVSPAGPRTASQGLTGDTLAVAGQSFIVQFPDYAGPTSLLRPVSGTPAYALAWDEPPYDRLYVMPGPARVQVAPILFH
jgi:hypothetical protein